MVKFQTKAKTLESLVGVLNQAEILPQISLLISSINQEDVFNKIKQRHWDDISLIVRSSFINEDTYQNSSAGKYLSIGDVKGQRQIEEAIDAVIASKSAKDPLDQIFIQPYLHEVCISGVAFSCDLTTQAPYRVISYDDESGLTSSVTSGSFNGSKTFYIHQSRNQKYSFFLERILDLLEELEKIFNSTFLDVEFAFSKYNKLYLLQVRPLSRNTNTRPLLEHQKRLQTIEESIHSVIHSTVKECGHKNILGVMPDWNPAEIIGRSPRPLSLSIYKELITDRIWSQQRKMYGYRDVGDSPILFDFAGLPYIDVGKSFESLIPSVLPDSISKRLLSVYLKQLSCQPHFHDKIEFEIVLSSYTFSLNKKLLNLQNEGFSNSDLEVIKQALHSLTNNIMHPKNGMCLRDLEIIKHGNKLFSSYTGIGSGNIRTIYSSIKDCKRFGTLPFAGVARSAFIARDFLNSLVDLKIFSVVDRDRFLGSMHTVCSQLQKDMNRLKENNLIQKYGHLREGTYDICSLSYRNLPERVFMRKPKHIYESQKDPFYISTDQKNQIEQCLREHQLCLSADEFMVFLKNAIEGREIAKFIFTKSVCYILESIARLGKEVGLDREQCSFLDIDDVLLCYRSKGNMKRTLFASYEKGQEKYEIQKTIFLPPLLFDATEVWGFYVGEEEPNYITLKKVRAQPCEILKNRSHIHQKIIMIPSADPGFDWLFSHSISGLITMYGGVNSHMAIRANELGLPAVIGVGEVLYQRWIHAYILDIDCENKIVRVVH